MNGGGTSGRVGAHPHLRVHAYGAYGGPLADAIVRFKYSARGDLALPLGRLLRDLAVDSGLVADAVVPVPLHPTRLVVRGFNQAALLAKPVAVALDAALVTGALTRRRPARTQAWLTAAEREHNVHATFAVRDPHMFAGRRILLIDDVTTTGATLRACGAALYQARARSVAALVLARTE
ncbi:MAG: ComF family protein [Myxococcales bacterium]|nr:ComF family protein [Myxococcales bacterium]